MAMPGREKVFSFFRKCLLGVLRVKDRGKFEVAKNQIPNSKSQIPSSKYQNPNNRIGLLYEVLGENYNPDCALSSRVCTWFPFN
jgi:hypothetical protein